MSSLLRNLPACGVQTRCTAAFHIEQLIWYVIRHAWASFKHKCVVATNWTILDDRWRSAVYDTTFSEYSICAHHFKMATIASEVGS